MNIKLFTHTDLDGVGCAILAYLSCLACLGWDVLLGNGG